MPNALTWALTAGLSVVAVIAALLYLAGPLLIYFTHRQAARPHLVAFKPGVTPLPADVDQFFHQTSWSLAQQGFEIVTGMFLPSQIENLVVALIYMVHRQELDTVIAVAMHNQAPGMSATMFHTEFVTRYRSGRILQTANAQALTAFPIPPQCVNSHFPSVRDPVELYRLHRAQCHIHGSGPKFLKMDEQFGGDPVAYMASALVEELDAAVAAGYMRLDAEAGQYRPTLKGAVLMTYGELWPLKGVRLRRRAERERAMLAELAYQATIARTA